MEGTLEKLLRWIILTCFYLGISLIYLNIFRGKQSSQMNWEEHPTRSAPNEAKGFVHLITPSVLQVQRYLGADVIQEIIRPSWRVPLEDCSGERVCF